jgi:hypothetical protein
MDGNGEKREEHGDGGGEQEQEREQERERERGEVGKGTHVQSADVLKAVQLMRNKRKKGLVQVADVPASAPEEDVVTDPPVEAESPSPSAPRVPDDEDEAVARPYEAVSDEMRTMEPHLSMRRGLQEMKIGEEEERETLNMPSAPPLELEGDEGERMQEDHEEVGHIQPFTERQERDETILSTLADLTSNNSTQIVLLKTIFLAKSF